MPPRKRLLFFLLIGLLTVAVGVIPDLVSDELKAWCLQRLDPSYPWYFIGFFVVGCFVLVALSGEYKDLFPKPHETTLQTPEREQQKQDIQTHLRECYPNRLNQKFASRQLVNLRRLTSKEGTNERVSDTFIPYNSKEIKEEIGNNPKINNNYGTTK